jgi:uncharacterized protein (UPF0264 family)
MLKNRKLLVSVFNAQEAREAILGGGRIIDSEDPRSALGNISPRHIMAISDAVLDYRRGLDVQLSTNIGEDQLLFRRSENGMAVEKSPYEIAGKAAQAAIGVACAMGTRVHPVNLVKVGVDGMMVEQLAQVLSEVVQILHRTELFCHTQVMSVLFVQKLDAWNQRKSNPAVRRTLVGLREFSSSSPGDPDAFDLFEPGQNYTVGTLRNANGSIMFNDPTEVSLGALIKKNVLPVGADSSFVRLTELFPHSRYFPDIAADTRKTSLAVIKAMVDATADAGADAIMLDTSILSKVANICLVDTNCEGLIDLNRYDNSQGVANQGILGLDEIRFFVDYCHYRGVIANVAGSITSYQAQQLWALIPHLDQVSTRGSASAVSRDPYGASSMGEDTRQLRVIKRTLVRGLAPPEHGGVLNIPLEWKTKPEAMEDVRRVRELIFAQRAVLDLPALQVFFVDRFGETTSIT